MSQARPCPVSSGFQWNGRMYCTSQGVVRLVHHPFRGEGRRPRGQELSGGVAVGGPLVAVSATRGPRHSGIRDMRIMK